MAEMPGATASGAARRLYKRGKSSRLETNEHKYYNALQNTQSDIVYWAGGLAQLARAPALHAGGRGFESHILHQIDNKLEFLSCNYIARWII